MTSVNIGVIEDGNNAVGTSLQLEGTGTGYSDFTWAGPITQTRDAVNTGQVFQEAEPTVDLRVTKSANSETVSPGSNVTYTITIANDGTIAAANATLDDPLPAGMTFVSLAQNSGPTFSCTTPAVGDGGTVNCALATFPAGASASFTLVTNVPPETPPGTFFTNIASASSDTPDANEENDSAVAVTFVPTPRADLGVSKLAASEQATPGADVTYTITLRNGGPNDAANATLTDTLPGTLTFVSLTQNSGPVFSCTTPAIGSGGTINCERASFAAGATATFTLTAHVPSDASEGTEFTNTATTTSDTPDPNEENNAASFTITIVTCFAAPFVNSNADSGPGTLRQAIQNACSGSTITFADGLVSPIALTSSELLIDKSLTIQGPGANTLAVRRSAADGTPDFRIFRINSGATVTISGLTISNGRATGISPGDLGGGILNLGALTLSNSILSDNSANAGGGIYNSSVGTVNVTSSTLNGNTANSNGGGIFNEDGGTLNVTNSTLSGNSAVSNGGGIYIQGNTATLTSVTLTDNRADSDNNGTGAGGGLFIFSGTPLLRNSIIAGNFNEDGAADAADDIAGTANSASSFNLIGTGGAGGLSNGTNNNQVGVANPGLGSLTDNGGPTLTHALLPGSPAIDQGSAFSLVTDQRGSPRPFDNPNLPNADGGDGSDIGAYEAQQGESPVFISGQVTFDSQPLSQVTVSLTGAAAATATTDSNGNYAFNNLAAGSYTVTPAHPYFTFTPPNRPYNLTGGQNITDANFTATSSLGSNPQPADAPLLISEFRLAGETAEDEFIELYNNTDTEIDISNYTVAASSGHFLTIPAATVLAPRAHYLLAHQTSYTLAAYAAADQPYNFDLPADAGLVLLNTGNQIVDAAGFTTSPLPYREGEGLAAASNLGQYSFVRRAETGTPRDTGANTADFLLVVTDPVTFGGGVLGAPGPQNLTSPTQRNAAFTVTLLDPNVSSSASPNRSRDAAATGPNAAQGTLTLRRTFTNTTGQTVTRLRFRIVDMTTLNSPIILSGQAELRALSSGNDSELGVLGTTVEEPPTQPLGGGWNTTMRVQEVDVTPIPPGGSINVQWRLGVQRSGYFRFFVNIEAVTAEPSTP